MQKRPRGTVKHEQHYRNYLENYKRGFPYFAIINLIAAVKSGRKIDLPHFLEKHKKDWVVLWNLKTELITAVLRQKAGG